MQNLFKWIKAHPVYTGLLVLLVGGGLLNVAAYLHARAMLVYLPRGERTGAPETLSALQKVTVLFTGIRIPKPHNTSTPAEMGLPFEVCHIQSSENIRLEAWLIPHERSACIVLMFPGYSAAKSTLLPEAKAFHESGHAVFLVDFRGSGGSSGNTVSIGYHEADDVILAVQYIRKIFPTHAVILYGRSMGSAAILRAFAIADVQADAIIIESVFDAMLSTVKNRFSAMGLPSFPGAHLLVFWGGIQRGFSGFSHKPSDYAKTVQCPVLMLHGENDPRVTVKQAQSVFHNLSGTKSFEVFKDIGHDWYYAYYPEQWTHSISQFLNANLPHVCNHESAS